MKIRTSFEFGYSGIVRCNCGSIKDFAEDLYEFVVFMLANTIKAEINYRQITVYPWDTVDSIHEKYKNAMRW